MFAYTKIIQGIQAVTTAVNDVYFNLVTLLLNTTSTNGAQNNTFIDSSSNGYSITRNPASGPNAPTQGTFTPFSQTGWSNFFDGTDDYLAIVDNALLRFGAGAFTLEAWIWRNASGAAHTIYAKGGASTGIVFQVTSTNVLRFTHTTTNIDSTGTISANSWTHVAVVREGTGTNQTKLYINGTQDGQGTVSTNFTQTEEVRIGTDRGATADFNGYISNLRFVKGTALYTTTFTPSTTPLTTTSQGATATEVELLTCQSNRFLDNSSNAFSITVQGAPSVQAFSPFAPTAAYASAVVGGSGYFDGSGDYLDVGSNANLTIGTSDFSISFWLYLNSLPTTAILLDGRSSAVADAVTPLLSATAATSSLTYRVNGTLRIDGAASSIKLGQWYYVVLSRLSGTTRLFANGVQQGSDYIDGNNYIAFASDRPRIGDRGNSSGAGFPLNGYISGLQILIGTGTSAPTTPTAPPTNVANTQLLLNYTNAGIFDASAKNNLETVGNAQVSTTQAKFGTASMAYDGTGDYLLIPDSLNLQLGTGDFTIDGFVYLTAAGVAYGIISKGAAATGWSVNVTSGNKLQFSYTATALTGATSLAATTWYYFAVTRSGSASGNLKLYLGTTGSTTLDATSAGAVTDNFNQTSSMYVGASRTGTTNLNGYLDEVRVTKGVARDVTTVPTAVFPVQ